MPNDTEVTRLLKDLKADPAASDQLYSLVYDELRRLAHRHLNRERSDHTLQTTALVNELYLKLVDQTRADWQNRAHFFAIASRAIRRILVDYARQRGRQKRGGGAERVPLVIAELEAAAFPNTDLVALDEALTQLRDVDAEKCEVVEMRFFGGLNNEEIAEVLGTSSRTVERHWRFAKAWLYRALTQVENDPGP